MNMYVFDEYSRVDRMDTLIVGDELVPFSSRGRLRDVEPNFDGVVLGQEVVLVPLRVAVLVTSAAYGLRFLRRLVSYNGNHLAVRCHLVPGSCSCSSSR